ncbi:AI-2E family transporter [Bowmanella sp. JS7-9]|uniref:AI-2E family transporter n=2 Tax=Pseudobowmanella zhangzhouensis TaxID=1537679 RepID=A0ABW1XPJ1_9ALTE|nr:AI-2E family transporter [Bowmanella sp. JS7-9]
MSDTQSTHTTSPRKLITPLNTLAVIAVLAVLYFAQSLLIPLVFSLLVALLLNPLVSRLKQAHVPRIISSVTLLTVLLTPVVWLGAELAEPAEKWLKAVPKFTLYIEQQVESFNQVMQLGEQEARQELEEPKKEEKDSGFFSWFSRDEEEPEPEQKPDNQPSVSERIEQGGAELLFTSLLAAPLFLAQCLGGVILTLFILVYGRRLFTVFIDEFPQVTNKDKVKATVKSIQSELSKYIFTVATINAGLGIMTATALYLLGTQDFILWGSVVALFNFVPYVGSVISLSMLLMAGLVQYNLTLMALAPATLFMLLNIIESQLITPLVLGRRMQVNPLIVILWLACMGWLWGMAGVLLALPILVCIKLVLVQMDKAPHWIRLVEAK